MPRTKISEYSTTNSDNTDIEGINIAENCPPSGINNAIREVMVHLKEFQTGASGDPLTVAGAFVASSTASLNGTTIPASATLVKTSDKLSVMSATSSSELAGVISDETGTGALVFANSPTLVTPNIGAATGTSLAVTTVDTTNLEVTNIKAKDGTAAASIADSTGKITVVQQMTIDGIEVGQGAGNVATNTAVGASALAANTTGTNNVAVGFGALDENTTGAYNIAIGSGALGANTTANENTAVGLSALRLNTTGINNTALGSQTLYNSTTASNNTAIGNNALLSNTTGSDNTAVGYGALDANTTGTTNTAIGFGALGENTTASSNTAVGRLALALNTTGATNTAMGEGALYSNTTASNNTAIGRNALAANTTGANNTAVGYGALDANTTGSEIIAIGFDAASTMTSGTRIINIGSRTNPSASGDTDEIIIGVASGTVTGKGSNTGYMYPGTGGMYQGNNSASWSTTSDRRLKKNIVDNNEGIEKIAAIRVCNFEYRLPEEVDAELKPSDAVTKSGVQLGVIAQELAEVCPDCVKTESTGVMSVNTDEIFWHMVNAIKQLKAEVDSLKSQLGA